MTYILEKCTLCPRACSVNRTESETGFCGQNGALRVARASLHMWEEPCISGTKGSGTIFFSGCSLGCVFCQNKDISRGTAGHELTVHELANVMLKLQDMGAHNINLVTPGHFVPQIADALL
ncbi:MAG: 4Fe-4S cluster-binding domain-containing protein, partial [Parasporobacterium sp.]|nr:4Fe-4S cluster-binding domain-containing protein [Parasporobacterium sp.]